MQDYAPMKLEVEARARNSRNVEYSTVTDDEESASEEDDPTCLARLMKDKDPWNIRFQMVTAAVILSCTFSMAIETDYCKDCSFWWWWNTLVLLYFCAELGIRMVHEKQFFFACFGDGAKDCFWNYFDLTIVVICITTQWVEPLLENNEDCSGLEILRIFRVFRILRTLRVIRIFKACDQLNKLANGLLVSIGTVFWIALLMLMVMLIFAIILTDVAGNTAKIAMNESDPFFKNREDIELYWGSVTKSLVTLFQMLTLDDWSNISKMVYEEIPAMWFVFFLYIFTMGFAMLSLLTGVVAEHMTEVSTDAKNDEKKEDDVKLAAFLEDEMPKAVRKVRAESMGSPNSMQSSEHLEDGMTRPEFKSFLKQEQVRTMLERLDACVADHEADEFWDSLDRNGDGQLTHSELKAGFLRLRGELQPKDMLRIRYAAERVARTLQGGQGEAATTRKLEEINTDLGEVDEKLKDMQTALRGFMEFVQNKGSDNVLQQVTKRYACT
mmetsp:Transcript_119201/g.381983  ORF Transcript_119201/g.381983 Transcript_119201/m.381983 type:complete len:497 (-) Transcript_119201:67-1557(-)